MSIEKMSVVVENESHKEDGPVYEKQYNRYGYGSRRIATTDEYVSGDMYTLDGKRYVLTNERRPKVFDQDEEKYIDVENYIYQQVLALEKEDYITNQARKERALELADKDEVLARVIYLALEFGSGKIDEELERSGIKLYRVGRNASHLFYLGTKGGKLYKAAMCPDWDENDEYIEDWVEPYEIESLRSEYIGHY